MSNKTKLTYIDAGDIDRSRPAGRPPKTNPKVEFMKKVLRVSQYTSPRWTAEKIWEVFTRPGYVQWNAKQEALAEQAQTDHFQFGDTELTRYRWGTEGPKVLLVHGWRSKAVDFRRLIEALVAAGYVVDGVDFRAHGRSEGRHTALPEFYDALKQHYSDWGPYDIVVGYSLGGLASGLLTTHLPPQDTPRQLFLIAAPPYPRYFFEDIIDELKLNKRVLNAFVGMVEEHYGRVIDWWDLRTQTAGLAAVDVHLIYDEQDETVPMLRGQELWQHLPQAAFVHAKGLGHYRIISHDSVIQYILQHTEMPEAVV